MRDQSRLAGQREIVRRDKDKAWWGGWSCCLSRGVLATLSSRKQRDVDHKVCEERSKGGVCVVVCLKS